MRKVYTTAEEQYLRDNYGTMLHKEMAAFLSKTTASVKNKCGKMRLTLSKEEANRRKAIGAAQSQKKNQLRPDEDAFVRLNYIDLTMHEIARRLGRAKSAVSCSMKRQGLSLTDEIRDARMRLTKGTVSHNKGRKQTEYMTAEGIERTKATQFKKGDKTHNAHPIGAEVIIRNDNRDYMKVKVAEPKTWKWKHILVWEQHFGPVQNGQIVNFKDGNTLNFDIENLQCITRSEHIRTAEVGGKYMKAVENLSDNYVASVLKRKTGLKNSDIPSELINLKRAQMSINRQLNHIQKSKKDESK